MQCRRPPSRMFRAASTTSAFQLARSAVTNGFSLPGKWTLSLIGEGFNMLNEVNVRGTSNANFAGRNISISPSRRARRANQFLPGGHNRRRFLRIRRPTRLSIRCKAGVLSDGDTRYQQLAARDLSAPVQAANLPIVDEGHASPEVAELMPGFARRLEGHRYQESCNVSQHTRR